jgi:hypothetical protein
MKTTIIRLLLLPLLGGAIQAHCAERFAGRFKGEGLVFEAQGDQGNYIGKITLGDNSFNFTASELGDGLTGSFATQDGQFDFKAVLKGDGLILNTGGTSYKLARLNSNPLARAGTGDKLKNVFRQQGAGFFHHFADAFAGGEGNPGQAAKTAALDSLVSNLQGQLAQNGTGHVAGTVLSGLQAQGSQIATVSPADSSVPPNGQTAVSQDGSSPTSGLQGQLVPASAAPPAEAQTSDTATQPNQSTGARPADPPSYQSSTGNPSASQTSSGLIGTWKKTDHKLVNGESWTKDTYLVLSADGALLSTPSPQTAQNFGSGQSELPSSPLATSQPLRRTSGRPVHPGDWTPTSSNSQNRTADLHGRWTAQDTTLTLVYDNGSTTRYGYEIRTNDHGCILRLQTADGGPLQCTRIQ